MVIRADGGYLTPARLLKFFLRDARGTTDGPEKTPRAREITFTVLRLILCQSTGWLFSSCCSRKGSLNRRPAIWWGPDRLLATHTPPCASSCHMVFLNRRREILGCVADGRSDQHMAAMSCTGWSFVPTASDWQIKTCEHAMRRRQQQARQKVDAVSTAGAWGKEKGSMCSFCSALLINILLAKRGGCNESGPSYPCHA